MNDTGTHFKGYVFAGIMGAVAGGLVVLIATRAIPKMMAEMMPAMMEKMMTQMEGRGELPEMCKRMMEEWAAWRNGAEK